MSALGFETTGAEVIRTLVALGCLMLTGTNIAFVTHARRLFAKSTYAMWRLFFTGKSCMTAYVGISIWVRVSEHQPLSWRTPLAAAGLICTNVALWKLYKLRALAHTKEQGREVDPGCGS